MKEMTRNSESSVSVVIPVYNAEAYLDEVLKAVSAQGYKKFEVIILYTTSKDRTLEICKKYGYKIIEVSPKEFNHGTTRNLGVQEAHGDFVAFLTQDAIPASSNWLQSLLQPMLDNEEVVAVFGRHIPKRNHSPFMRRSVEEHFKNYRILSGYLLHSKNNTESLTQRLLYYYSDVNSCLRRSYWQKHPYKKIAFAEDQLFGREVIETGFIKAYSADAAVFHSHHYSIIDFFKRLFEEYRGLKISLGYVDGVSFRNIIPHSIYSWIFEIRYILKQNYSILEKVKWSGHSFPLCFLRYLAALLAGRHEKLPGLFYSKISLKKVETF